MTKKQTTIAKEAMVIILDNEGSCHLQLEDQQYRGCISVRPEQLTLHSKLRFRLYPEEHLGQDRAIVLDGRILAFIKKAKSSNEIKEVHLRLGVNEIKPLHMSFEQKSQFHESISLQGDYGKPLILKEEAPLASNPFKQMNYISPSQERTLQSKGDTSYNDDSLQDFREFSGVLGTLRQVSLVEVIQGFEFSRKTAMVEIHVSNDGKHFENGKIYVSKGQIVHAEYIGIEGVEAIYLMASLNHGTYRVKFARITPLRTVTEPTGFILLEAMRRRDVEAAEPFLNLELENIVSDSELSHFSANESAMDETIADGFLPYGASESSRLTAERSGIVRVSAQEKVRSLQDGPIPEFEVNEPMVSFEPSDNNRSWDHIFSGFFQEMSEEESIKPKPNH